MVLDKIAKLFAAGKSTTVHRKEKIVVKKDGETREYASFEELPDELRELIEKTGSGKRFSMTVKSDGQREYTYNGKAYSNIDDIPDAEAREEFRRREEEALGKLGPLLGKKDKKADSSATDKKLYCPACRKFVAGKKDLFGRLTCETCGAKIS